MGGKIGGHGNGADEQQADREGSRQTPAQATPPGPLPLARFERRQEPG